MGGYRFPFKFLVTKCEKKGKTVFKPHWHEQLEILCIISGELAIQCDQREFHATKGDIAVFNPGQLHRGVNCSDNLEYDVLVIDPERLVKESVETIEEEEIAHIAQNLVLFHNIIQGDSLLYSTIVDIFKEYEKKEKYYGVAIRSNVYKVLITLLRNNVFRILGKSEYATKIRLLERYQNVLLYIEKHFNTQLTVSQLALMANISEFHFIHVFKTLTGYTLRDYINELRIEKAELLLRTTSLNVTELSEAVGFANANYFCRVFKKKNGSPPIKFRASLTGEED